MSEIQVEVRKITDVELLKEVVGFVLDKESTMTLEKIYRTRHSPLRTQFFLVKMVISTECSVHFVRHQQVGQFHYVSSNRPDWNSHSAQEAAEINRQTPVRHVMILNAEHLMQMAAARLCSKALKSTQDVMRAIRAEVKLIDPKLAERMKPKCFQQGGMCYEDDPCGKNLIMLRQIVEQIPEQVYRDWRNDFLLQQKKEGK